MNTLEQGIRTTWQIIGDDVCQCDPDFNESDKEAIAEIVLDASHLEMHGNVSDEELKVFKSLPIHEQLDYAALVL